MKITKERMKQEAVEFLQILFSLHEVEKITMKDILIPSIDDKETIDNALDLCYHDKYSDIDFVVYLNLHPTDYYGVTPVYKNHLSRLGLDKDKFGIAFIPRENGKEGIRICKSNGIRMDIICIPYCDKLGIPLDYNVNKVMITEKKDSTDNSNLDEYDSEKNMEDTCESSKETISPTWDLEKVDWFWFVLVQALGKLMRKDYLIAAHLANILVNETLVAQMIIRDKQYNTNYHRFGFGEKLEYLEIYNEDKNMFANTLDETYNHIARLLYSAAVSYDNLIPQLNEQYKSMLSIFIDIWNSYISDN